MRSVAILGATGSIGAQALEIVRDSPDLRLVALSAHSTSGPLMAAAREHGVGLVALTDEGTAAAVRGDAPGRLFEGRAGAQRVDQVIGDIDILQSVPHPGSLYGVGCRDLNVAGPGPVTQLPRVTCHAPDTMPRSQQFRDEPAADIARRPGHKTAQR